VSIASRSHVQGSNDPERQANADRRPYHIEWIKDVYLFRHMP
jgi:hypothetical protein